MNLPHKDKCLIACPRCDECAVFQRSGYPKSLVQANGRGYVDVSGIASCRHCGYSAQLEQIIIPDSLFLKDTRVRPTLFAFDGEHLQILADFFSSTERKAENYPKEYYSGLNKMGKNLLREHSRDSVLRALKKMQDMLERCGEGGI